MLPSFSANVLFGFRSFSFFFLFVTKNDFCQGFVGVEKDREGGRLGGIGGMERGDSGGARQVQIDEDLAGLFGGLHGEGELVEGEALLDPGVEGEFLLLEEVDRSGEGAAS